MARSVAVKESRTCGHVAGEPCLLRKRGGESDAQRVPLVVVEEEGAFGRRRKVSQAPADAAGAFHRLMRISRVQVNLSEQFGGTHRGFIAHDARALNGEGNKEIGIADRVVVKVIVRTGAEIVKIEGPAMRRNGQADLVLLIALAPQREK